MKSDLSDPLVQVGGCIVMQNIEALETRPDLRIVDALEEPEDRMARRIASALRRLEYLFPPGPRFECMLPVSHGHLLYVYTALRHVQIRRG